MTTSAPGDVYAPTPSPDSAQYWEGLRQHELRIPFCTACQRSFFPPMPGCPRCGADADKIEQPVVSGEGEIYSWIVAHLAFDPAFADDVPYTVVTVDLAEGARIVGRLRGIDPAAVQAGMKVRAEYEDLPTYTMLYFAPSDA